MLQYLVQDYPVYVRTFPSPDAPLANILPINSTLYVIKEDSGWFLLHNGRYVFRTSNIKLKSEALRSKTKKIKTENILNRFSGTIPGSTVGKIGNTVVQTGHESPEELQQKQEQASVAEKSAQDKSNQGEDDKTDDTGGRSRGIEAINTDFVGKPWMASTGHHVIVMNDDGTPKRDANGDYVTTETPYAFTTNYSTAIIESIDEEGIIKVVDFETNEEYYLDGAYGNVLSAEEGQEYDGFELTEEMLQARQNSSIDTFIAGLNSDYQEQGIKEELAKINTIDVSNTYGIFGYPYQFLPIADPRVMSYKVNGSSNTVEEIKTAAEVTNLTRNHLNALFNVRGLGRKFMQKIASRAPILVLTPGRAQFMQGYSDENKSKIIEALMSVDGIGETNSAELDAILDRSGMYYTFKDTGDEYFSAVNEVCHAMAYMLGIQKAQIPGLSSDIADTSNKELGNFMWQFHTQHAYAGIYNKSVCFYVHVDPTISESFSNGTRPSELATKANQLSEKAMELQFALGGIATAGFGANLNANILEEYQDFGNENHKNTGLINAMINNISTFLAGGKMIFPEIWNDSQFQRQYNVTIKLISPDADPISIYLNILVPLAHILGFVLPRSAGSNAYITPFLVKAFYKSVFNIDLGIIASCEVSKGDSGAWSQQGLPTQVTVQLGIKDLYNHMYQVAGSGIQGKTAQSIFSNPAQLSYIANLCGVNIEGAKMMDIVRLWVATKKDQFISTPVAWTSGLPRRAFNAVTGLIPVLGKYGQI